MAERPVKDYDKFVLRLPEGMRDAIAERAKRNGRSMNSEIVQILEDALRGPEQESPNGLLKFVNAEGKEKQLPLETVRDVLLYAADVLRNREHKDPAK